MHSLATTYYAGGECMVRQNQRRGNWSLRPKEAIRAAEELPLRGIVLQNTLGRRTN